MNMDEFYDLVKSHIRLHETHKTYLRLDKHTWGESWHPSVEFHLTDGVSTAASHIHQDNLTEDYAQHIAEFLVQRWAIQRYLIQN